MNLDKIPIFAALTEKMKWLTARQNVLAQNIANSDTPNYRARDLKPLEFREMIEGPKEDDGVQISRTNMRHIFVDEITSYETVINRESSETEMMKVAETQIQYELTTSLYKKNLGMLKTALGRR